MKEEFKKTLRNIPLALKNPFKFKKGEYLFYSGEFDLISNIGTSAKVNGKLFFKWENLMGVNFQGIIIESNIVFLDFWLGQTIEIDLQVNSHKVGKIFLVHYDEYSTPKCIDGFINGRAKYIQSDNQINQISFVIPNFKEQLGNRIKSVTGTSTKLIYRRLAFETKKYRITLDCIPDYNKVFDAILDRDGIAITYIGKLEKLNGQFNENEIDKIFKRFRLFLSFVNGSWTAPMLIQAKHNRQICWSDYSGNRISPLSKNRNWCQWNEFDKINKIWSKIIDFTDEEFEVLNTLINWYIESQHNQLNNEAAIILAQNGLELLFNLIIIENNKNCVF